MLETAEFVPGSAATTRTFGLPPATCAPPAFSSCFHFSPLRAATSGRYSGPEPSQSKSTSNQQASTTAASQTFVEPYLPFHAAAPSSSSASIFPSPTAPPDVVLRGLASTSSSPSSSLSSLATTLPTPPSAIPRAAELKSWPQPTGSTTLNGVWSIKAASSPKAVGSVLGLGLDPLAPTYEPASSSQQQPHSPAQRLRGHPSAPDLFLTQEPEGLLSSAGASRQRQPSSPTKTTWALRGISPARSVENPAIRALWEDDLLEPQSPPSASAAAFAPSSCSSLQLSLCEGEAASPAQSRPRACSVPFPNGSAHQSPQPSAAGLFHSGEKGEAELIVPSKQEALARLFEVEAPASSDVSQEKPAETEVVGVCEPAEGRSESIDCREEGVIEEGSGSEDRKASALERVFGLPPGSASASPGSSTGRSRKIPLPRLTTTSSPLASPAQRRRSVLEPETKEAGKRGEMAAEQTMGTPPADHGVGGPANGMVSEANGKPRLRGRSQSSAAVLSPPHSPPISSLALDPPPGSSPARAQHAPSSGFGGAGRTAIGSRSNSVFTPTARPFEPSSLPNSSSARAAAESAQRWWNGTEPSPAMSASGLPPPASPSSVPRSPFGDRYSRTVVASTGDGSPGLRPFPVPTFDLTGSEGRIIGVRGASWADEGVLERDRQGRPLFRPSNDNGFGATLGSRDLSVGSMGSIGSFGSSSVHSGIGISNRSPFAGTSMLPAGGFGFPGTAAAGAVARGRPRESSLGAVGSGRGPLRYGSLAPGVGREGWMSGGRSLTNDLDEDDEFAAGARSGATSRRHSVAAFTGRSVLGFDMPSSSGGIEKAPKSAGPLGGNGMFGSGNSALTDDDLLANDINSLQINLEAHAAEQQRRESQSQDRLNRFQQSATARSSESPARPPPLPSSSAQMQPLPAPLPTRQARAPSFSAGDPYSASAQVSRFFVQAQQQQQPQSAGAQGEGQPPQTSRFAFGQPSQPPQQVSALPPFVGATPGVPQQAMSRPLPSQLSVGPPAFFPAPTGGPPPPYSSLSSPLSPFGGQPSPNTPFAAGAAAQVQSQAGADLSELGKGVPLHQVPASCPLYIVEFNQARTDLFYLPDPTLANQIQTGDYVIVEADRGKDLGKVVHNKISTEDVQVFQQRQVEIALGQLAAAPQGGAQPPNPAAIARLTKEMHPKKIYAKASHADAQMLLVKAQDEAKALALCRSKALQKGLAMEITAAEWQWDRRKLTFFFIADKRVDFRELVRELFRIWKTRIWMCSVNP